MLNGSFRRLVLKFLKALSFCLFNCGVYVCYRERDEDVDEDASAYITKLHLTLARRERIPIRCRKWSVVSE